MCEPGACTEYSSTNYVLAGIVLLAHAPEGGQTWETFDMMNALGMNGSDF